MKLTQKIIDTLLINLEDEIRDNGRILFRHENMVDKAATDQIKYNIVSRNSSFIKNICARQNALYEAVTYVKSLCVEKDK